MLRELDTRRGGGLSVRLLWDEETGATIIERRDALADDGDATYVVAPGDAGDAFRHPYRYGPSQAALGSCVAEMRARAAEETLYDYQEGRR